MHVQVVGKRTFLDMLNDSVMEPTKEGSDPRLHHQWEAGPGVIVCAPVGSSDHNTINFDRAGAGAESVAGNSTIVTFNFRKEISLKQEDG